MRRLLAIALATSAALALPPVLAAPARAAEPVPTRLALDSGWGVDRAALTNGGIDVESGDVSGDGRADMVRLAGAFGGWRLVTTREDVDWGTQDSESVRTLGTDGDAPGDLALGDVDGDGDLDALVALSGGPHSHALHRNDGDGTWPAGTLAARGAGDPDPGARLRLADADGDGDLDMLRLDDAGALRLARGDGTGAFGAAATLTTVAGARTLAAGDLTGDGRPDVALGTGSDVVVVRNDGAGGLAGTDTYAAGPGADPLVADVTGDGAADLVAGTGAAVLLLTGDDAPRPLLAFGASDLHLSGPDLVGMTPYGVFVAQRSGDAFTAAHSSLEGARAVAAADVTGDGLTDVLAARDASARLWRGTPYGAPSIAIEPTVTLVNATHSARFTARVLNAPEQVEPVWSVVGAGYEWDANPPRGTFAGDVYTAPSTAEVDGTRVGIVATLPGSGSQDSRTIIVHNALYSPLALAGREVRAVVEVDAHYQPVVYAGTDDGVHRATEHGQFSRLGTGGPSDVRGLVVGSVTGGPKVVVALSGGRLHRFDGTAWAVADEPSGATSVTGSVNAFWAAAGGQLWHSTDGLAWRSAGGTDVVEADARGGDVWAVRSTAPRLARGSLDGAGALALTPVETPFPERAITELTLGYDGPYVTFDGAGVHRFDESPYGTDRYWSPLGMPGLDAVDGSRGVVAWRRGSNEIHMQDDDDGTWSSLRRGFPDGVAVLSAAGSRLVGTTNGLYGRAYTPYADQAPDVTALAGQYVGAHESSDFEIQPRYGSAPASYLCTLDGAIAPCPSPVSFPDLAEGSHRLEVRAVDEYGFESAPSYPVTWTVDRQAPPAPVITSAPEAFTTSATATFGIQTTSPEGPYCTLDGEGVPCGSTATFEVADGQHTFAVWNQDAAANESARLTHTWTVDAQPPDAPVLTSAPAAMTTATGAAFAWEDDDETVHWTCAVDGAEPVGCGDRTLDLSGLAEGSHSVSVRAYDYLDRFSVTTHTWVVDLTAPASPVLTTTPLALTSSDDATFLWTLAGDVVRDECVLDAQPRDCFGGVTLSNLPDGSHSLTVRAYDAAGHVATTTYAWTVDTAPPALPFLTTWPRDRTNSTSAAFVWLDDPDAGRWTCSLDRAAPVDCSTRTFAVDGLAEGGHSFTVSAYDAVGHVTWRTYTWVVDLTPPVSPVLTTTPPPRTAATTATFAWKDSLDRPDWTCAVDGAAPVGCSSRTFTATGLAGGGHSFTVRAHDEAGNVSSATYSWTVDHTPPAPPVLTGSPSARTSLTWASFAWNDDADVARWTCSIDGASPAACQERQVGAVGLAEGAHSLTVRAYDEFDNVSSTTYAWTVDTTAPGVPVLESAPPAVTASTSATFTFVAPGSTTTCSLDGAAYADCETGVTYVVGAGAHTFAVRAADDLGNVSEPVAHSWAVDTAGPAVTVAAPPASLTPTLSVTLDEPGTVALALRTGTTTVASTTTATSLTPVAPLVPGQLYTLTAVATDALGNVAAPVTRTFRAPGSQQENSVAIAHRWRRVNWAGAKGGWFSTSHVRGASTAFAFTGTSVTWHTVRGPSYGLADVYVDGVLKASRVNLYAPTTSATTRTIGGLGAGAHTLRVFVRGERGSSGGTGSEVAVDAFTVGTTLHASPAATWSWTRPGASGASGGAYAVDDAAGASFSMTFRGRAVDWVTVLGPNMGLARVTVDGVVKGTFDNYASTTRFGAVRSFGGLSDGVHTITVTVLGQRRAGATGSLVAVDRLDARP